METQILSDEQGIRVDIKVLHILKEQYGFELTRTVVQEYFQGGCKVNGKPCKRSYRLKEGDLIYVDQEYWQGIYRGLDLSKEIKAQKGTLDIRYEDDELMVLYKPKGLVVHPGVGNKENTLANYLREYLESRNSYDSLMDRSGIVHRLDKGVSGLMVVAKNKETQEYLKTLFQNKDVVKIYHAYLEESKKLEQEISLKKYLKEMNINLQPWKDWLKVEGYIGRSSSNRYRMEFKTYEFDGSKYALSYIFFSGDEALIKIETGRMHQIRCTLKHLGYHIKGDSLYGKGSGNEIMLESVLLSFKKRDGEILTLVV